MRGWDGSIRLRSFSFGSPMYSFISSGSGSRTFSMVCVVRKPSWTFRKGVSLSSAARRADQGEVASALGVLGHDDAPAGVGHAHDVVVAGVDVEAVAGERAGADVEDDGQALAGDDVEHLLHQDQALAGGEVRHAAAGEGESFAAEADECSLSGSMKMSVSPQRFCWPLATAWA